ncbi:unnamed protein product [Clavelina lepadiformis]|uniref:U1-type domain-containing protein n=1 Tax=Clavelina lepadiformis TaxID=159417 RepID=A0ABP0FKI9_CLALP
MAYLKSLYESDTHGDDFTKDIFSTEYGPLGISGFNCDGKEVGTYCYMCDVLLESPSLSFAHFSGKKHATKLRQYKSLQNRLVIESSTGDADDPDNLFLPSYCKVCDATLAGNEQTNAHYQSEKHQKKVRNYFLIKVGAKKVHPLHQQDRVERKEDLENCSKMEYCSLCGCELSSTIVARTHYAGKKHAKKLKEKAAFDALADASVNWERCNTCSVDLNSKQQYLLHISTAKHKANVEKELTASDRMRALARRREEIETQISEDVAKRRLLETELLEIDSQFKTQKVKY